MLGGDTALQIINRTGQLIGMYDLMKFVTGRKFWK